VTADPSRAEVLGLLGSSGAYLLSALLAGSDDTLLVLAADGRQAEQFAADLAFYHGHPGDIFLFPHWEMRPYEPAPHPETEATRLAALAALHEGGRGPVVTVRAPVTGDSAMVWPALRPAAGRGSTAPPLLERLLAPGHQPRRWWRSRDLLPRGTSSMLPPTCASVRIESGDHIERCALRGQPAPRNRAE
jgi:transcription-repair coupling factor (superfamily II helicase)